MVEAGYHEIGIGGSRKTRTLMSHINYLRELDESGRIEEMFVHEASNVCLRHHQNVRKPTA